MKKMLITMLILTLGTTITTFDNKKPDDWLIRNEPTSIIYFV